MSGRSTAAARSLGERHRLAMPDVTEPGHHHDEREHLAVTPPRVGS